MGVRRGSGDPPYRIQMIQQVVAICLVLGLLGGTLWLLRRKGLAKFNGIGIKGPKGAKAMTVLERMPLTAQHSLHLVRVRDETILIGVSPSGCTQIASFTGDRERGGQEHTGCASGQ